MRKYHFNLMLLGVFLFSGNCLAGHNPPVNQTQSSHNNSTTLLRHAIIANLTAPLAPNNATHNATTTKPPLKPQRPCPERKSRHKGQFRKDQHSAPPLIRTSRTQLPHGNSTSGASSSKRPPIRSTSNSTASQPVTGKHVNITNTTKQPQGTNTASKTAQPKKPGTTRQKRTTSGHGNKGGWFTGKHGKAGLNDDIAIERDYSADARKNTTIKPVSVTRNHTNGTDLSEKMRDLSLTPKTTGKTLADDTKPQNDSLCTFAPLPGSVKDQPLSVTTREWQMNSTTPQCKLSLFSKPDTQNTSPGATDPENSENSIPLVLDAFAGTRMNMKLGMNDDGDFQNVEVLVDTGGSQLAIRSKDYDEQASETAHSEHKNHVRDLMQLGDTIPVKVSFYMEAHDDDATSKFGFDDSKGSGWRQWHEASNADNQFTMDLCDNYKLGEGTQTNGTLFPGQAPDQLNMTHTEMLYAKSDKKQQFLSSAGLDMASYPVEITGMKIENSLFQDTCWKMNGLGMARLDTGSSGIKLTEAMYNPLVEKFHRIIAGRMLPLPPGFFDENSWEHNLQIDEYNNLIRLMPDIKIGLKSRDNPREGIWITIPPESYLRATAHSSSYHGEIKTVTVYNMFKKVKAETDHAILGTIFLYNHTLHFDSASQGVGFSTANCDNQAHQKKQGVSPESYRLDGGSGSCTPPVAGLLLSLYGVTAIACGTSCVTAPCCVKCCYKKAKKKKNTHTQQKAQPDNIPNEREPLLPVLGSEKSYSINSLPVDAQKPPAYQANNE